VPGEGSQGNGARGGLGVAMGPGGESWSHEACGGPGAVLCQETGARPRGAWRSRSCCGPWWLELEPRGTRRSQSCPMPGAGATGHVAVPELLWALVAGAGATRHVTVPELSCARRRELGPRGTWRLRSYPVLGQGSRETRGHVHPSCLSSLT
jgi:hypothetical protein